VRLVSILVNPQSTRERRLAAGATLREVSRRTEINPGRLSIIERGVPPSDDEAARIEAALVAIEAEGRPPLEVRA